MKKRLLFGLFLSVPWVLTSCEVHWGGKSYEVQWWVNAVLIFLILSVTFIVAGLIISKTKYSCPKCNGIFYPKWWKAAFSIHMNSDRVFKCPHCGRRGFCNQVWGDGE